MCHVKKAVPYTLGLFVREDPWYTVDALPHPSNNVGTQSRVKIDRENLAWCVGGPKRGRRDSCKQRLRRGEGARGAVRHRAAMMVIGLIDAWLGDAVSVIIAIGTDGHGME